MNSLYYFDPAEVTVRRFLKAAQDTPIHVGAPTNMRGSFATVQKVGGLSDNFADRPMITIVCWAEDDREEAALLAERLRQILKGCEELGGVPVYQVREISGPTYREDPDTRRPRYQFTLEFKVRGKLPTPSP